MLLLLQVSTVSLLAERANVGNMSAFRALRTLRALRPLRAVARWEGMRVLAINSTKTDVYTSLFIAQINSSHDEFNRTSFQFQQLDNWFCLVLGSALYYRCMVIFVLAHFVSASKNFDKILLFYYHVVRSRGLNCLFCFGFIWLRFVSLRFVILVFLGTLSAF